MIRARLTSESIERRERDLNPRGALSAPNRLAGDHLRPLGHPSEPAMVPVTGPPFGRTSARQAPVLAEPRFARSLVHHLLWEAGRRENATDITDEGDDVVE